MTRGYTDAELVDTLRAFAADHDGRAPMAPEANAPANDDLPSVTAFTWHFGTWNAAVEAAGLDVRNRHRTDEGLLADLRELVREQGKHPAYAAVGEREDMATPQTYENRFGSWGEALDAVGLATFVFATTTGDDGETATAKGTINDE